MPGSCDDCGNCEGFHDEGYGSGEYICKLDGTPEGCPECEGNGPCPGWVPIETDRRPSASDPHTIAFSLRDCIAVSVLRDIAETMEQPPLLDMALLDLDCGFPTFTLELSFSEYCYFEQEFGWATAMTCDMDQECGLNYISMKFNMDRMIKEAKE